VIGILAALALAWYFFLGICIFYCGGPVLLSLLMKGGDIEGAAVRLGTMSGVFSGSMFQRTPAITSAGDSVRPLLKPAETSAVKSLQNISAQLAAMTGPLPPAASTSGGTNAQTRVPQGIDGNPLPGFINPNRRQDDGTGRHVPAPARPKGAG